MRGFVSCACSLLTRGTLAAIRWSADFGDCPGGDPELQMYIGELYYRGEPMSNLVFLKETDCQQMHMHTDRQFVQAEHHLVASGKRSAANMLADMVYEWCEQGKQDPGVYACRVVLP